MSGAPFRQRAFGGYLLVAQLSEDSLGTVYRALDTSDGRRFVRLRVLQSPELSPPAVLKAIRENAARSASVSHEAIVSRGDLGLAGGAPYLAWSETAGWTLDTVLARLRAERSNLPIGYGLWITERVASALEHAACSPAGDAPIPHGLLWPGFVSVSNDAQVRVGGFGLAEAVLPALGKPRLSREVAPYIAPEVREEAKPSAAGDVFSMGALLLELLSCRRPCLDRPLSEAESGAYPEEIRSLLRRSLCPAPDRFSSALEMGRLLRELLIAMPPPVRGADLALFLYELLNPESRSIPASSDGDSTNPIAARPRAELARASQMPYLPGPPEQEAREDPFASVPPTPARPPGAARPLGLVWAIGAAAALTAVALASGVLILSSASPRSRDPIGPAESTIAERAPERTTSDASQAAFAKTSLSRAEEVTRGVRREHARSAVRSAARPVAVADVAPASDPSGRVAARSSAEDVRLQAGLARIEAERLEAAELASAVFGQARDAEKEGERLFQQEDYPEAQGAFDRAVALFRQAEILTREERVRRVRLTSVE